MSDTVSPDLRGSLVGEGVLRRRPAGTDAAASYAGTITVAGFPYLITGEVEMDGGGKYFRLRTWTQKPGKGPPA